MIDISTSTPAQKDLSNSDNDSDTDDDPMAEFDRHRRTLITHDREEDWNAELRRYLRDMPDDVTVKTDFIDWWSVCIFWFPFVFDNKLIKQENAKTYPTLARIALDVLPSQASAVPCEWLFSSAKLTTTDRRSRLKAEIFEILQIMKATWHDELTSLIQDEDTEVIIKEFESLLVADEEWDIWGKDYNF
jgi:hAT family C-terminal dimerisation region